MGEVEDGKVSAEVVRPPTRPATRQKTPIFESVDIIFKEEEIKSSQSALPIKQHNGQREPVSNIAFNELQNRKKLNELQRQKQSQKQSRDSERKQKLNDAKEKRAQAAEKRREEVDKKKNKEGKRKKKDYRKKKQRDRKLKEKESKEKS